MQKSGRRARTKNTRMSSAKSSCASPMTNARRPVARTTNGAERSLERHALSVRRWAFSLLFLG